jgi:protein-disulfide isomerase
MHDHRSIRSLSAVGHILVGLVILHQSATCAQQLPADKAEQQPPSSPTEAAPSIQQQLQEIKTTQQQILQQLAELRALLQTVPRRSDYPTKPLPANTISLDVQGEPFRGGDHARIAIVEYSDFDCSFCANYATEVFPRIDAEYIKTDKIKYFFRDFPAPEHTNSLFKARLVRCAGEQGKFWETHDRLFADQKALSEQEIPAFAQALGLDVVALKDCLDSGQFTDAILRSVAGAKRMGLQGTPAFIVGTLTEDGGFMRAAKVLVGAESYESLKAALDELMAAQPKSR